MKTWLFTLLVLTVLVIVGGCSSSAPDGSTAFAPGAGTPASDLRGTSALSWGSPSVVDRQKWGGNREGTSIGTVDGNPAVSYVVYSSRHNTYTYTLYYVRASDSAGTSWGRAKAIDSWAGAGNGAKNSYTSLCVVNNSPAVCYTGNDGLLELRYVRAKDSTGNKWGTPITVDNSGNSGTAARMLMVNGAPAISYIDFDSGGKYVRALDQNGDTWGAPMHPDPSVYASFDTFSIVDGKPAMAYAAGGSLHELRYIRAADANGDTWNSPQIVQSGATDGRYAMSRLSVANGSPAIAFSGNGLLSAAAVYYIRATDADGTAWPSGAVTVSSGSTFDWLGSMTVINGLPSIAFVSANQVGVNPLGYPVFDGFSLSFAQALDASGSSWEPAEALVDLGTGASPALAAVGSGAGIAYYDASHAMNYVYGQ